MKRCLLALAAVIVSLAGLSACFTRAQEQPLAEKSEEWMKKKLELSQKILAGLARADFNTIGRNAEAMNFLGYLEKWTRADMPEYKRQVGFFEFANQELIRQAKDKNLEGATLAFNQLTVTCVDCHRIVRDVKK
jgi:hypothetical protein